MGGLLIVASALVPTLLWADVSNAYVWISVLTTAAYAHIGFADDYLKIVLRNHAGLLPRYKMGWQIAVALVVGLATAGFVMTDLPADSSERLLTSRMHTLGGATLMLLTVARLVVRRRGPAVTPLPVSVLHRRGIGAIHALLYAVTFAIGASGVVTGALSTWPNYLWGQLAEAPALEALASREAHELLVFALLALVALHVGGVMLQQIRSGGVLKRMVPFLGGKAPGNERGAK